MTGIIRSLAIAVGVAAFLDPSLTTRGRVPVPVDVHLPPPSSPDYDNATRARDLLRQRAGATIQLDGPEDPRALVLLGNADMGMRGNRPVFALSLAREMPLRITAIDVPDNVLPGQSVIVAISLQLRAPAATAVVTLEREGASVAQTEQRWTADRSDAIVQMPFVATTAGIHRIRVRAKVAGLPEAVADQAVVVRDRSLRLLVYEPRPSWALTFVRRALEEDALFSMATVARTSRTVAVTAGESPRFVSALDADKYDVILVAAPDEVNEAEWQAFERFVGVRGGRLFLLPDRALRQEVRDRFNLPPLEEVLLEKPRDIRIGRSVVRASELLMASSQGDRTSTIASIDHRGADRAILFAVRHGAGDVVVSGLLDAWRYRAENGDAAAKFWRGLIADAAAAAPPKLAVRVRPAITRPDDPVTIRATWRKTEWSHTGGSFSIPNVQGALVAEDGRRTAVRFWPAVEPGSYEATIAAPASGRYLVSVSGTGGSADVTLRVDPDVIHPIRDAETSARFASEATDGAVANDMNELVERLQSIEARQTIAEMRPMQSPWWMALFSGLLFTEWLIRRRRGLP